MKKYLFIALVLFASCKKDTASRPAQTVEPSIVSYTVASVRDGGSNKPQFTVSLISDSSVVSKVELVRGVNITVWEVIKPVTGTYIMHDHLQDYPTAPMMIFYHFRFIKKDGSKVETNEFQVY